MGTKTFRIKEDHPAQVALNQLFERMEELGIQIVIDGPGNLTMIFEGKRFTISDLEISPREFYLQITELPPQLEYKLTYEKEC
jgi:hypothetical protein